MNNFRHVGGNHTLSDDMQSLRDQLESARIEIDELTSIVEQDKRMTLKNLEQVKALLDMSDINDEVMMTQATEIDQLVTENESLKFDNDRLRRQLKAKDAKIDYLMKLISDKLNQLEE